jgi:peptidoglycan hydrolase CwlO-like protein
MKDKIEGNDWHFPEAGLDYHDRLEQEVTRLKRDIIQLETQLTVTQSKLKVSERENDLLTMDIQQLHQAIAVLNDEPTNSL